MKNKELLNICYKFFNSFITADELIKNLSNIDKTNLTKEDINEINELLNDIRNIADKYPNKVDNYVVKKKEDGEGLIKKNGDILNEDSNSDFLTKQLESLEKSYSLEINLHDRWLVIADYIIKNNYFNKIFESLSDYELLEFIAQYIQAPFPPSLDQEEFDRLVKIGIEKDKREWLWRLAFNYEGRNISFDSIADYFIKAKDGYYLIELISAVGECLDIDSIIDKINDKELIEYLNERKSVIRQNVTEEQFNKLTNKLN